MLNSKKLRFDNSGYFFIAILIVAFVGFTPSYFSKFSDHQVAFDFYTHFHAFNMVLWVSILIVQPFLIRYGHANWHKRVGKFTYLFFPVLIASMVLLIHSRLNNSLEPLEGIMLYIPLKDLLVIVPCYCLAIYYRKKPLYHARFILGASMQLIEPALIRALMSYGPFENSLHSYLSTISIIDGIVIALIIMDRKQPNGRWIFPLILVMILTVQTLLMTDVHELDFFTNFTRWFASLNLS